MKHYIDIYRSMRKKLDALEYASSIISWDQEVNAPKLSASFRSNNIKELADMKFSMQLNPEYINAVEELYKVRNTFDEDFIREIAITYKKLRIFKKVPRNEYIEYQAVIAHSINDWKEARDKNDFKLFIPTLEKIVNYNKKVSKYLETEKTKGYDVLLDMHELGMKSSEYDSFFEKIKTEIIPLVIEVTKNNKRKFNKKFLKNTYPVEKQKEYAKYVAETLNFDFDRGIMAESVSSFVFYVSTTDVRVAISYDEKNIFKAFLALYHEFGHAIYEQQIDEKYDSTILRGGSSSAIHESQSRLYENMIGKSFAFCKKHYFKLQELFPKQFKGIEVEEFYQYVNQVKRTTNRANADELTYPLHVIVRYEIEKELIEGNLKVKDIQKKWRQLMSTYVGKRPIDDKEGVLQDINWATDSMFGFFPTYAIGSAYAAQIYNAMSKTLDIDELILENKISIINDWLKENVHKFGKSKTPKEILKFATEEEFNPKYYIEYLKEKFKV